MNHIESAISKLLRIGCPLRQLVFGVVHANYYSLPILFFLVPVSVVLFLNAPLNQKTLRIAPFAGVLIGLFFISLIANLVLTRSLVSMLVKSNSFLKHSYSKNVPENEIDSYFQLTHPQKRRKKFLVLISGDRPIFFLVYVGFLLAGFIYLWIEGNVFIYFMLGILAGIVPNLLVNQWLMAEYSAAIRGFLVSTLSASKPDVSFNTSAEPNHE